MKLKDVQCMQYIWGLGFVRVIKLYSELCLLNGTIWGATFGTGRGGKQVTPKIVPFGISVLAVVTNITETLI